MPDERIAEYAGTASGSVRGRTLRGQAMLRVGERGLAVALDEGELRLPYGRVEGWVIDEGELSVRISGGDVVRFSVETGARAVADALAAHACVLPELTRGLRALGSSRSRADSAQAALFAPLLGGRRRAARMRDPADRIQALDAEVLSRELTAALDDLAAARVRHAGPERRALVAALEDALAPLQRAVRQLGGAAARATASPDERRLVAWREWTEAVRLTFSAADACWPAVRAALDDAPRPSGSWRRWMASGP